MGRAVAGYRIEELIGRGGMGLVYRAEHLTLGRRAAIKLIAPEHAGAPGFRERFAREARIAAALQHPNVVTVYDAGEDDGLLYLALRYVDGSDLAAVLHAEGRLRPQRALDLCGQVGAALDAAHAQGLIHRDVKPANVLLEGGTAFLTDFGLTMRTGGTQVTRAGDMVGTIHYVAPEQIEGGRVDARADVYSLGCLLHHCLTGAPPFVRDSDVAVMYAHLSDAPPRVTSVLPELPRALDAVIAEALEKVPERRFGRCADLIAAARDALPALHEPTRDGRHVPPAGDPPWQATVVRPAVRAPRRPRVLLAGVDAETRAIARVAVGTGIDLCEATNGEALLDSVHAARPDLVIAAGGPAGAAVAALRGGDAKVLVIEDEHSTRSLPGADDRLAAPFSPLQLQVKLRRLLGADAVVA